MKKSMLYRHLASAVLIAVSLCASALAHADSWSYAADVDKMTSGQTKFAAIRSDNALDLAFPYKDSNNYGQITVRSMPRSGTNVLVSIAKGQIMCPGYGDGCTVTVRFDQAPPVRFSAIGPSDNSSTVFFIQDTKRFIALASKAKKILVQFTVYQAGNQVLEFSPPTPLEWGAAPKKKK